MRAVERMPMSRGTRRRTLTLTIVAAGGLVLLKGGAYWHGFDIETGEPQEIDVPSLSRAVRDQLVLVDAAIHKPETYAAFAGELACPNSLDASPPPLRAANRRVPRAPVLRNVFKVRVL
jgi:hypothetical protein